MDVDTYKNYHDLTFSDKALWVFWGGIAGKIQGLWLVSFVPVYWLTGIEWFCFASFFGNMFFLMARLFVADLKHTYFLIDHPELVRPRDISYEEEEGSHGGKILIAILIAIIIF